jgi:hypothetical protein
MATSYKVLGQVKPSANTLTTAYTVPSSTEAVISTIVVTNLGPTSTTYRIAIRKDGANISQEMYIAYDISIPAVDSLALTLGVTINAADVISVESYSGLVNFHIFGSEIA